MRTNTPGSRPIGQQVKRVDGFHEDEPEGEASEFVAPIPLHMTANAEA